MSRMSYEDAYDLGYDGPPSRNNYRCTDGMCGALDCERCYPGGEHDVCDVCSEAAEADPPECYQHGHKLCPDCVRTCASCSETMCEDCALYCPECGSDYCAGCFRGGEMCIACRAELE